MMLIYVVEGPRCSVTMRADRAEMGQIKDFNRAAALREASKVMVCDVLGPVIGESAASLLVMMKIHDLSQVAQHTRAFFLRLHGFGPQRVEKIDSVLRIYQLSFTDPNYRDELGSYIENQYCNRIKLENTYHQGTSAGASRDHLSIVPPNP